MPSFHRTFRSRDGISQNGRGCAQKKSSLSSHLPSAIRPLHRCATALALRPFLFDLFSQTPPIMTRSGKPNIRDVACTKSTNTTKEQSVHAEAEARVRGVDFHVSTSLEWSKFLLSDGTQYKREIDATRGKCTSTRIISPMVSTSHIGMLCPSLDLTPLDRRNVFPAFAGNA